jgi:hypothetical protein
MSVRRVLEDCSGSFFSGESLSEQAALKTLLRNMTNVPVLP